MMFIHDHSPVASEVQSDKKISAVRPMSMPLFSGDEKRLETVSGHIMSINSGSKHIANWRSGFIVIGIGDTIKFAGNCSVNAGDSVRLHGVWEDDPRYGRQFRVSYATAAIGRNYDAIQTLFEKDESFRHIGPKRSRYIVDYLCARNMDLEDVLESDNLLDELRREAKLPDSAVEHLVSAWARKREENVTKAELISLGAPIWSLEPIWRAFRGMAVTTIKENPYVLTDAIDGFGISDADKIAKVLGIHESDPRRISCGITFAMKKSVIREGHTWITRRKLVDEAIRLLNIGRSGDWRKAREELASILESGRLTTASVPGIEEEVVCDPDLFAAEQKFARMFSQASKELPNPHFTGGPLDPQLVLRLTNGNDPSDKQIEAVRSFTERKYTALTGAAGTGKTFTVTMILRLCQEHGLRVALAAPTGKAAMRLHEMMLKEGLAGMIPMPTGNETPNTMLAMTIHRMLGYQGDRWTYNETKKLPVDVLIVDEMSMTDISLMGRIIDALPTTTAVVMVGDHNQLPSVGPGAIFRDVIDGEMCRVVRLETVFRQAGALRSNAADVLRGVVRPTTVDNGVETWRVEDKHKEAASAHEAIVSLYRSLLNKYGEQGLFDVQVLSPMYDGAVGIDALNSSLRMIAHEVLYNSSIDPESSKTVGDKVIQTKNDYTIGIMNGDQGIIRSTSGVFINQETGRREPGFVIELMRETREEVNVPYSRAGSFMLAFAISVHRYQGSESDHIIGAAHSQHKRMLNRPLIYTTSTRASKTLTLIGDREGIHGGAKENGTGHRKTLTAPPWLIDKLRLDRSA